MFVTLSLIALVAATIGIGIGWWRYHRDPLPAEDGSFWRDALSGFYVDDFYGRYIVAPGKRIAEWFADFVDPNVIDGAAGGIARGVRDSGSGMSTLQTGQVRWYAGGMAVAGVVMVGLFLFLGGAF
jgi:NADH:ubiquinone oxidoreductase subunit 5 (subunit L)/multisubunit Na+/H+ antiporter MnhA subunit